MKKQGRGVFGAVAQATIAIVSAVALVSHAMAQTYFEDRRRAASATHWDDKAGENEAAGLELGPLDVHMDMDVDETYHDNIFYSENNPTADLITRYAPSFNAVMEIDETERFVFSGLYEEFLYADQSSENREEWRVSGVYEKALWDPFHLTLRGYGGYYSVDRLSLTDVIQGPRIFYTMLGYESYLRYDDEAMPWTGFLHHRREDRSYEATPVTDYGQLDRVSDRYEARFGYRIVPDITVFIQPAFQEEDFDQPTDQNNVNRDAYIFEFMTGIAIEEPDLWYVEAAVGLTKLDNRDPLLEDDQLMSIRAKFMWDPVDFINVSGKVYRDILLADRINNYQLTRTGFDVEVNFSPVEEWILKAKTGAYYADFHEINRQDLNMSFGLGAEYILNEQMRLSTELTHDRRDSDVSNESFDANTLMLRLNIGL